MKSSRSLRLLAGATALAATAAGVVAMVPAAQAATNLGAITFAPASGTLTTTIQWATARACPAGATNVFGYVTGKGLPPGPGQAGFDATYANVESAFMGGNQFVPGGSAGYSMPVATTFAELAERRKITLAGDYQIVLVCNSLGPAFDNLGEFRGTVHFTSPTAWTTGAVAPKPVLRAAPSVAGTARVGAAIVCRPGTWAGASKYSYAWFRNGAVIGGASAARYVNKPVDAGKRLSCRVTASSSGGATAAMTKAVVIKAGVFALRARPTIVGKVRLGQTVRLSAGAWTPKPAAVKVQWLRNGKPIKKANKVAYKIVRADKGKTLSGMVLVRAAGYTQARALTVAYKVA